jgi:hypothetical protein
MGFTGRTPGNGIKIAKPSPARSNDEFDIAVLRVGDTFDLGSRLGNYLIIAASAVSDTPLADIGLDKLVQGPDVMDMPVPEG